jgi:hypothetical protein
MVKRQKNFEASTASPKLLSDEAMVIEFHFKSLRGRFKENFRVTASTSEV